MARIKAKDPDTYLNVTSLRRWVKTGKIKSFDGGKIALVDLDELEKIVLGDAVENS